MKRQRNLDESEEEARYPLQISGHLPTTGFICWFRANLFAGFLQSDKWKYDKVRNLPRKENAGENGGAIFCKGSELMKRQRNL